MSCKTTRHHYAPQLLRGLAAKVMVGGPPFQQYQSHDWCTVRRPKVWEKFGGGKWSIPKLPPFGSGVLDDTLARKMLLVWKPAGHQSFHLPSLFMMDSFPACLRPTQCAQLDGLDHFLDTMCCQQDHWYNFIAWPFSGNTTGRPRFSWPQ